MTRRGRYKFQLCVLSISTAFCTYGAIQTQSPDWFPPLIMGAGAIYAAVRLWTLRNETEPVVHPPSNDSIVLRLFAVMLGFASVVVFYYLRRSR